MKENMKKLIIYVAVGVVLVIAGFFALNNYIYNQKQGGSGNTDSKNLTYSIEGEEVELVDGVGDMKIIPGSQSKVTMRYFGNEAEGDINGDGVSDTAFLLTKEGAGSGTFYYVIAALKTDKGYEGLNAVFLGDRIAPQSTQIVNGEIVVNYADRRPNEPMTATPSVGVTKYVIFYEGILVAITK